MNFLYDSPYAEIDREILHEEFISFKRTVRDYNLNTPFYVYCLCFPSGVPFYVGKGKGSRAFSHLKEYLLGKTTKLKNRFFNKLADQPPIMYIIQGNLTETDALAKEKMLIKYYGRYSDGGILCNIMPGGVYNSSLSFSSEVGRTGGSITKKCKLGIFSPDYNRGAQTRKNWTSGLMDHIDFTAIGKLAGAASVSSQKGIHDPANSHKRSEWAKIGAKASLETGPHGPANIEWRNSHPEFIPRGSNINAKRTGNLPWWNNGKINKRSEESPGEDFVRGQLQSEKKLQSIRDAHVRRKLKLNKGNV